MPLGLTATTREIANHFEDHFFSHGHTYEAHPLTLAPAIAAIGEYVRMDLLNQSRKKGEYLGKRLTELKDRHPSIGDVRGLGLFWAIELVKNRETKEPFYTAEQKLDRNQSTLDLVSNKMMQSGVFVVNWLSHFVIAPPLIISEEQIDEGVSALDESLRIADRELT